MLIELKVCREYKTSHSHFLGGPDRWTQDDRDKAIAEYAYTASSCPSCGTRANEWEDDPWAYEPKLIRCRGCELRQQKQDTVTKEHGRGIYVVLERPSPESARSGQQASRQGSSSAPDG